MPVETVDAVTADTLIGLFVGDELSEPCYQDSLAFAICTAVDPDTLGILFRRVFGDWPADVMPLDGRVALERGFNAWGRAGKPRR